MSDSVAFGIPAAIVGVGIIIAIALVVLSKYSKPSLNIVSIRDIEEFNDKNIPHKRI